MKNSKLPKPTLIIALFILIALLSGCDTQIENASDMSTESSEAIESSETSESVDVEKIQDKLTIVASLFPHYDFARTIAGDYAEVTLILPPGIESHAYEPTPRDIIKITESDLFLYTNEIMEPWAHSLIESMNQDQTMVIDLSTGVKLIASNHEHEEEEHEEGEYDPHYWLDPNNAIIMVESIKNALVEAMPEQKSVFEANAAKLISELETLDRDFTTAFEKTQSKTILSGGHFAFGYFAKRYGLENMSPYVGFSPDAEPTPRRIADLIDTIDSTKAKAIFYEELIDPRVATIISEEAGVEMLLLHGAHNISKDELAGGITYIDIMKGNLERLKIGLGYVE